MKCCNNDSDRGLKLHNTSQSKMIANCNNPNIDLSLVKKLAYDYLGPRASATPFAKKIVKNVQYLIHSEKVYSFHRLFYTHRRRWSIERDLAMWIVLIVTLNFGLNKFDGEYFRSPITLTVLNKLCSFESLSRAHRAIKFYASMGLIYVEYKRSRQNKDLKYCQFYIHKDALSLMGASETEIDNEVMRANERFEKKATIPGTRQYEQVNHVANELDKTLPQIPLPFEYRTGETGIRYMAKERLYELKREYPNKQPGERLLMLRRENRSYYEILMPP